MFVFGTSFISGMMVGVEVKFLEPKAPYHWSVVLDLLLIRLVFQKYKIEEKNVRRRR